MKNILLLTFFILCGFAPVASSQVNTTKVAGVSLDNTSQVRGSTLVLNGAGVRTKAFFKIYVAGLYLATPKKTAAEVGALRGPKRLTIVMLRDITTEDAAQDILAALNANMLREERSRSGSSIAQFTELFQTTPFLKKGDVIELDWVPDSGLECSLNGESIGEPIGDASFYQAVLRVWLGNSPVDRTLKAALLQGNGTH